MEGFVSAKGEELYVEEVRHIRNFDDWLGQVKITLRNCFVSRAGEGWQPTHLSTNAAAT